MHVNDWVEVRSKQEILQTLDKNGRLDGMPFMPQMFKYCGKRFKVYKSAHKACDPVYTMSSRSLDNAVHLNLRCDGQACGGCQAGCLLFWKEAWLKPLGADITRIPPSRDEGGRKERPASYGACTEEDVWRATRRDGRLGAPDDDTQFVCQNTELPNFTKPLRWWNPAQYAKDYASGNVTLVELIRGGIYVLFGRHFGTRIPVIRRMYNAFQKLTGGMPSPVRLGTILLGQPQPAVSLNLQPGDFVRIKSHDEILATLNTRNMNRGMCFDSEMVPYCGGLYRVITRVERFIDEKTGRMRSLKTPAVILEDVACRSRFAGCRMFCPRAIYCWWREIWLERVEETGEHGDADSYAASSGLQRDHESVTAAEVTFVD
jgi:hypothetical protein